MSYPVPPEALVLIAVMPQPRDLDIARLFGWYRIPYKHAPKTIAVDYLAFYQPGVFGADHGQRINWVPQVRGHELVTRAELLRDEPDHSRANERYFKIQIGPLQRLPHPVLAKTYQRLTFLFTTGEKLQAANTLADLRVDSVEREILWKALRERGLNAERTYRTSADPAADAGANVDLAILCELGALQIQIGDDLDGTDRPADIRLHLPERMIRETPDDAVAAVCRAVTTLGGAKIP